MKDNAINKIYKITNNALGISLIVTQAYYAEVCKSRVTLVLLFIEIPAEVKGGKTPARLKVAALSAETRGRRSPGLMGSPLFCKLRETVVASKERT